MALSRNRPRPFPAPRRGPLPRPGRSASKSAGDSAPGRAGCPCRFRDPKVLAASGRAAACPAVFSAAAPDPLHFSAFIRALHPGRSGNKYTILHGRHQSLCYGKVKNGAGANAGDWVYNAIRPRAQSENPGETTGGGSAWGAPECGCGLYFYAELPDRIGGVEPPQIVKDTDCIEVKS